MSPSVLFDVTDGIATLTLNRPDVRNAIDLPTAEAVSAALDEVEARDDITVGVLTATGTTFSAGMDLKTFNATGQRPLTERGAFGIAERPPAKPLLAAVEGKALGGGLEIVLACDLIVAAEDAVFGLPEVKRGLVAAAGGALRLPRRIPRAAAMELLLTGEPITAQRAADLGLVNRVVPPATAADEARRLAGAITVNAPLAVRTAKFLADVSVDWPFEEAFARQAPYTDHVRSSEDAAEGARAFVDKRAPVWTGE